MKTWDDNEYPMAFLITFRSYGTWLHGDKRGSVDKLRNVYGTPRLPHRPDRESYNIDILKRRPVVLNVDQVAEVHLAIQEACHYRRWFLHAQNVRTNHVHAVVSSGDRSPGRILNTLKSRSTRRLPDAALWTDQRSPWSDKGSIRWLWDQDSLDRAYNYVKYCQGPDLIDFEDWQISEPTR